jgi:hypothetical protein
MAASISGAAFLVLGYKNDHEIRTRLATNNEISPPQAATCRNLRATGRAAEHRVEIVVHHRRRSPPNILPMLFAIFAVLLLSRHPMGLLLFGALIGWQAIAAILFGVALVALIAWREHRAGRTILKILYTAAVLLLVADAAHAQDYVHGVLATFRSQQQAINNCMVAVSEHDRFTGCMLTRGYKFSPECSILGVGGYPCGVVPGSTTSAPCWIAQDAGQPDKAQPSPQPIEKPCADPVDPNPRLRIGQGASVMKRSSSQPRCCYLRAPPCRFSRNREMRRQRLADTKVCSCRAHTPRRHQGGDCKS